MSRPLLPLCLSLAGALALADAGATVTLSRTTFRADDLPVIQTDESLPEPYRLRAKIAGSFHAANQYNNNGYPLESVPGTGTFTVELYHVLYDDDWQTVREVGPFHTQTITVLPGNQPPLTDAIAATASRPGGSTTLTGRAHDPDGNLRWLHFFTNDPFWSGYVYAGSADAGGTAEAQRSITWTLPASAPTGTYRAHLRAQDSAGAYDANGGVNASFDVRRLQPDVTSQDVTAAPGTAFTPSYAGGAGTGPWQFVIEGQTNCGGGQPGTLLPPANTPSTTWTVQPGVRYTFWVVRQGDSTYAPSNFGGPYYLHVLAAPPTITSQPQAVAVNAGQPTAFTVVASGGGVLSYQWRKDGLALSGATAATLLLPAAQPADAGNYSVVVSNAAGSVTSAPAALTVNLVAPVITVQPASQLAVLGQSIAFQVAATGSAPLLYQWKRNGTALAGATAATYVIPAVQTAHAAAGPGYTVEVSNSRGTATSAPATLAITTTPPIRLALQYWQPNDWPDYEVGTRTEPVWVEYRYEPNEWDDEGNPIGWEQIWDPHWEEQTVTTYAPDGQHGSRWDTTVGTYEQPLVAGTGAFDPQNTQRGHLRHSYPPGSRLTIRAWAYAPANNCSSFSVSLHHPVNGLLEARGIGQATYAELATTLGTAGTYRIDLSYFGATATSPASGTVSYFVSVGSGFPPVISLSPLPAYQSLPAGSPVTYRVEATGAQTYQWYRDGLALGGATLATLVLPAVTSAQAGTYRVVAGNSAGTTTSLPAVLAVTEPAGDADGDGLPDAIEQLLGTSASAAGTPDSANTTLQLKFLRP